MKTKCYTPHNSKCRKWLLQNTFPIGLLIFLFHLSNTAIAQYSNNTIKATALQQQTAAKTLKQSTNTIWFEKNEGQFADKNILYGFRTPFGNMGVFNNKLRIVAKQNSNNKNNGYQVVDITFPGSKENWSVENGIESSVKGSYNTPTGTITPGIYNEIVLKQVYDGVDLRLYSGDNGALEFDWLVNKAVDYEKIRMKFNGQKSLRTDKKGNLVIALQYDDMKISIPETYQVINNRKNLLAARMNMLADNKTVCYTIKGNLQRDKPLVIDPVMTWSTFVHNNTNTFDEYLYTVAANTVDEIYACGLTNEAISATYLSGVAPGYSGTYVSSINSNNKRQTSILYKLNSQGTAITAWTYTGLTTNVPVAMSIFPNNNVIVLYQKDTIQIFSPDLLQRLYNGIISQDVADNVSTYQSLAIVDDNIFYVGGIAGSALPSTIIPTNAPDASIGGNEGVILRINNSSATPVAEWGTYIGGSGKETFTAIALTPDKSKLAFAVHTEGVGNNYPLLVNAVDNSIAGNEILTGNFDLPAPTSFNMFSYLGGSGHEGGSNSISNAALVTADNDFFYVAGNTSSTSLPGAIGTAQTVHGANNKFSDQFLSRIPLNGSVDTGFVTTFNGGNDVDLVGGLVLDSRTGRVLIFGTTMSNNFPVYSPNPFSPYYQSEHGPFTNGTRDITYTIFSNDLRQRIYSTYIGGSFDDYLGSTGRLEGTGHFQYSYTTGLTYIGTTIHSDETSIPAQWMSGIPGFDKSVPPATLSKDNHYIFAINPNTSDYGDAPDSYDSGEPANSALALDLRIGYITDAEDKPNSSALANGDDLQNYGYGDDEDGIVTAPSMFAGATSYTVGVSVFNKTGRKVQLCGWIDTDGNGLFDPYEYTEQLVASRNTQQDIVLSFTGLPPFNPMSGKTYLRIRISNVTMTNMSARGVLGKGEVEDYIIPQAVILPVTIQQFTATLQNENSLLQWNVANEINIRTYEVEHSTDNRSFTSIGEKAANNTHNYSLIHFNPAEGTNYYRIKMIGTDGSISYSPSRKVNLVKNKTITISPNPAKDIIHITFGNWINKPVTISVMAADGKVLAKKVIPTVHEIESIDASLFAKGYYFVKIETGGDTIIKTISVTH